MKFIQAHPFPVKAYFDKSIVLTYSFPVEKLVKFIPKYLEVDSFQNKYGFIAIAMVQARDLRPSFFPKFLGSEFFLTGYRIFVRYRNKKGKRLRGLHIIKSETDKRKMKILGDMFTNYKYDIVDIKHAEQKGCLNVASTLADFSMSCKINTNEVEALLPENSPFATWKEARRFAGPMPFTFSVDERKNSVCIVKGVRQNWNPQPITVLNSHFSFFSQFELESPQLASAFLISDTPYSWEKGITEQW